MKSKSAILILTAASLLTGCANVNSEMNESSAVDSVVSVGELKRSTTVDTVCSLLSTVESVTAQLTRITTTTTQTTTMPVTAVSSSVETEPEVDNSETKLTLEEVSTVKSEPEVLVEIYSNDGKVCSVTGVRLRYTSAYHIYKQPLTANNGVVWYGRHKETYYSEKVLPGPRLAIPDRHHGEDGTIRDADGYICVAADYRFLPYGSIVLTSLGPGKVYDTGCAWGTIDIYTCW